MWGDTEFGGWCTVTTLRATRARRFDRCCDKPYLQHTAHVSMTLVIANLADDGIMPRMLQFDLLIGTLAANSGMHGVIFRNSPAA